MKKRSLVVVAGVLLVVLMVVASMSACSKSHEGETVARSSAAITPENDAGAGTTVAGRSTQEPSGAFANARALVVGFNTNINNVQSQGWAVSNDFGLSFQRQCDFNGTSLLAADAGPSCAPVPIPVNSHIPTGSDGGEIWKWAGDPTVVADGRGDVAYVSMGNPSVGASGADFVAVAVSQNGGGSWDSTVIANDTGCGNGVQDQPNAVFDYTTDPPTLWVVWRHAGLGTIGTSGACVRRGVVDKSGGPAKIRWLDDPHTVTGLANVYQYGMAIAAGDGVVTVMYSNGFTFLPNLGSCTTCCPDNGGLFTMSFGTVDSFDDGATWDDNAQIYSSPSYQWCVIGGAAGVPGKGSVLAGLRPFGLVRAPGGMEYAVIQDSRHTARLFMSPAAGLKGYEAPTTTIRTWFEWCPGTPTSSVDGGPTSNWKSSGSGSDLPPCGRPAIESDPGNTGLDLVFPTIAADGRGSLAIGNVQQLTNGVGAPVTVNYAIRGIVDPQRPGAVLQPPRFLSPAGFQLPTGGFFRPIGDYGWMAVRPNVASPPLSKPGCTTTNDFFPLYTANDGTGVPDIITRGYSLTP